MSTLFEELLLLHIEHDVPIQDSDMMVAQVAAHHHYRILQTLLDCRNDAPDLFPHSPQDPQVSSEVYKQRLLFVALSRKFSAPALRRLLHGKDTSTAQERTIKLLLDDGADLSSPEITHSILTHDNDAPMAILLDTFRDSGGNPKP